MRFAALFRNNGSAMLWAVGVLFISAILSLTMLGAAYSEYQRAVEDGFKRKAEMLAQSGMIYAQERIINGEAYNDISWQPDISAFEAEIVSMSPRIVYLDGVRRSENCAEIIYRYTKTIKDEPILIVTSRAEYGGFTADCSGIFSSGGGAWIFEGYAS